MRSKVQSACSQFCIVWSDFTSSSRSTTLNFNHVNWMTLNHRCVTGVYLSPVNHNYPHPGCSKEYLLNGWRAPMLDKCWLTVPLHQSKLFECAAGFDYPNSQGSGFPEWKVCYSATRSYMRRLAAPIKFLMFSWVLFLLFFFS